MTGLVRFGVLGTTTVIVDGRDVALRSGHQRRLIAALALADGDVVSTDRLADAVWGEELPADPPAALQNHVSRLRHALGSAADVLLTVPGGYRLDGADVDANVFESGVASAREEPDPRRRAEHLKAALGLWRGAPYEELESDGARAEATRLLELRLAAEEDAAAALIDAGDVNDAIAALDAFCAAQPLRERPRLALAEALARTGRAAEALRTLDDFRRVLVAELGIDPSAAVGQLAQQILEGTLDAAAPSTRAMAQLPRLTVHVFGRDDDLAGIVAALRAARLLSVVGPGGVGKTTLAVLAGRHLAGDYDGGVVYVDLVTASTPDDVPGVFARALGVERRPGDEWDVRLVEALAGQRLLLVVDNAEHVIAAAATTVAALLRGTDVDVLATSREPLNIPGERLWPLDPLATTDADDAPAVLLFHDRARAVRPDWTITAEDRAAVVEICRRLDGLPLAIELAAAQIRFLSCNELAARLEQPLDALDRGPRTAARHQGLRAVMDWSYELLDPQLRAVFDRVGVFAQGFVAESAAAVCADVFDDRRALEGALQMLVERSLVRSDVMAHSTRYSLLETLRHYACENLAAAGILEQVRDRHAAAIVELTERAVARLWDADEAQWARTLDDERPDLLAAHRWCLEGGHTTLSFRLAYSSYLYAFPRGRFDVARVAEEVVAHDLASPAASASDAELRSLAYGAAADRAVTVGDLESAALLVARGLEFAATSPPGADRLCRGAAADLALFAGRADEAVGHYRAAADGFRRAGPTGFAPWLDAATALAMTYGGRLDEARDVASDALAAAEIAGGASVRAFAFYALAEAVAAAEPAAAREHLADGLHLADAVGASWIAGLIHLSLATLAARAGDPAAALPHYRVLLDLWRRAGTWTQQWNALRTLVVVLSDLGRHEDAARLLAGVEANAATSRWGEDDARLRAAEDLLRSALGPARYAEVTDDGARRSGADVVAAAEAAVEAALSN